LFRVFFFFCNEYHDDERCKRVDFRRDFWDLLLPRRRVVGKREQMHVSRLFSLAEKSRRVRELFKRKVQDGENEEENIRSSVRRVETERSRALEDILRERV